MVYPIQNLDDISVLYSGELFNIVHDQVYSDKE